MCGITGIYAFNQIGRFNMINLAKATAALESRGPDYQGLFNDEFVGLGHRRLSVIDTSFDGNQPMQDPTGRYQLVFNGEIYNYKQLRQELAQEGVSFLSQSDTEVLLQLLIKRGISCLNHINGFFAFSFYDSNTGVMLIARDRFGIKPLLYYQDQDKLMFASELKSIFEYGIDKELNLTALFTYLQLNYTPAPMTMLKGIKKLMPGEYLAVKGNDVQLKKYYTLTPDHTTRLTFDKAVPHFERLMEEAVKDRLVADVPLGTFLSGGLDSSIISAIAAKHSDGLQTFSIGYKDEPFFDETKYAESVAKHIGSEHRTFKLSNADLYDQVFSVLDYLDEPFGDSSALAVSILSRETRKYVTVALSGDGADELFAGYNKHAAMWKLLNPSWQSNVVNGLGALWKVLPKSRNGFASNKFRQFDKFTNLAKMTPEDQYWAMAGIAGESQARTLMAPMIEQFDAQQYENLKSGYLGKMGSLSTMNPMLLTDINFVLPNDMLTKVDMMSMANSLEVRVPFLDHRIVEFASSLPDDMKINRAIRKRIAQEAFRSWLPAKNYNRPKKGFEVPLMKWFKNELRPLIEKDLLADEFIESQGIFDMRSIQLLKKQLFSQNPGDAQARVWGLISFQWWHKRYFV